MGGADRFDCRHARAAAHQHGFGDTFSFPRGKKAAAFITSLFTAGVCLLLAWYTFEFVKMEYESPTVAFASVPTWVCEAVMPVAFFLIGIRYVIHAVLQFRSEGVAAP